MIGKILKLFLGTYNERVLKKIMPLLNKIKPFDAQTQALSDEELKLKTKEFQERYQKGESLDSILPEAFSVLKEASGRTLGMRHFDVQLLGGIVLHQGNISEMKTGEGKTLVATLPLYLHALTGKGVHVVTVNDYLAKRDCEWMSPLYDFMGLTSGALQSDMSNEDRIAVYQCDIVYGTNSEFGFDYLRDNMKTSSSTKVQRGHYFCLVDEVDSVLIDEARTPLIISGPAEGSTERYYSANGVVPYLKVASKGEDGKWIEDSGDFILEEKDHHVSLTEQGISKVEEVLGIKDIFDPENIEMLHAINQSLKAHKLYNNGKEYLVENSQVIIVDENTGRKMEGRRYGDGLHQAIEAKENVVIQRENQTMATITIQNYFKMYDVLSGMTGTAETEAPEFLSIYNMDVIVIPTNKPIARKDMPDVVYKNKSAKYKKLVEEILEIRKKKAPILIGTITVETSEEISQVLTKEKIPHNILNAKNHLKEALIVSQAGSLGSVTIATNMAGRGTDIVLGGNYSFEAENYLSKIVNSELLKQLTVQLFLREVFANNFDEAKKIVQDHEELNKLADDKHLNSLRDIYESWKIKHNQVLEAGGLHVLGTERHEARRIDNQLRGRSGRQGDAGYSRFYMSLEDDLFRLFGSEKMLPWLERAGFKEDDVIESKLITRMIESSQRKVEARNFEIRKHLLQYDEVMNTQRRVIYEMRDKILFNEDIKEEILFYIEDFVDGEVNLILDGKKKVDEHHLHEIIKRVKRVTGVVLNKKDLENHYSDIISYVIEELNHFYSVKEKEIGAEIMREAERLVLLEIIDDKWKNHLYNIDELRDGVSLRSYGEKNPLVEYQLESARIFEEMLINLQEDVIGVIFRLNPSENINFEESMSARPQQEIQHLRSMDYNEGQKSVPLKREGPKVGRNDACPCGSGKKYKHCHGKNT